jgi:hypothetical protein
MLERRVLLSGTGADSNSYVSASQFSPQQAGQAFGDNFNRSDSNSVDNGWIDTTGNTGQNLGIVNGTLSGLSPSGEAGINRPWTFSEPLTFSGTLTYMTGYASTPFRYGAFFALNNDGSLGSGYGLRFTRGDANYNDSAVAAFDGSTITGMAPCDFQFTSAIIVNFTISSDGSINGSVSDGTDVPFSFGFGSHPIQSVGNHVAFWTGLPDPRASSITEPTLDNLTLNSISPTLVSPSNIQATQGTFSDHVHVTWNAVDGAQSYEVLRSTSNDFNSAVQFPVNIADLSYDDTTAHPGTTYYYWVIAHNAVADSDPGGPATGSCVGTGVYESALRVFSGSTEVTTSTVQVGKPLRLLMSLYNPTSSAITARANLGLTNSLIEGGVDFKPLLTHISAHKTVTLTFTFTPRTTGTLTATFTIQSRLRGSYFTTDSGIGVPAVTVIAAPSQVIPTLDIRPLTKNTDIPYKQGKVHLGADFNSRHDRAGDVGTAVLSPVSGRVIFFGKYGAHPEESYGDLLVAIEVPLSAALSLRREDFNQSTPVTSGFVTVFLGHLSPSRYLSSTKIDPSAPKISLTPGITGGSTGTWVRAGVDTIGYIAPRGAHNGGFSPHVHVGILPYSEDRHQNRFENIRTHAKTAFPGFWLTSDTAGKAIVQSTLIDPTQPNLWALLG